MPNVAPYLGVGWSVLFGFMQSIDPVFDSTDVDGTILQTEIWPIAEDEALKLGAKTQDVLGQLPKSQRVALETFISKYMPFIALGIAVAEVAGPRAQFSLDQKKDIRAKTLAAQTDFARRRAARPVDGSAAGASAPTDNRVAETGRPDHAGVSAAGAWPDA